MTFTSRDRDLQRAARIHPWAPVAVLPGIC
jgi:hypothetical protein